MDEEKKKYLEELRKQIDPDVLSKMANYLGAGNAGIAEGAVEVLVRERHKTAIRLHKRVVSTSLESFPERFISRI